MGEPVGRESGVGEPVDGEACVVRAGGVQRVLLLQPWSVLPMYRRELLFLQHLQVLLPLLPYASGGGICFS